MKSIYYFYQQILEYFKFHNFSFLLKIEKIRIRFIKLLMVLFINFTYTITFTVKEMIIF